MNLLAVLTLTRTIDLMFIDLKHVFEQLKQTLMKSPVPSYPLPEGKFILDTESSNVGVGAVLS